MKILHYYHDLMNLYGDYANVSAMRRILEKSGESVTVDRRSLGDNVDFSDYDFIYIGSGTERNQRVALADLHRHADALRQYIADGKPALLTGNSFEMLGRTITDAAGNKHKGLGVFDFTVTEQNKTRVTADVIFTCEFLAEPLVGFVNKCSEIRGADPTLFNVKMGLGNFEGRARAELLRHPPHGTRADKESAFSRLSCGEAARQSARDRLPHLRKGRLCGDAQRTEPPRGRAIIQRL